MKYRKIVLVETKESLIKRVKRVVKACKFSFKEQTIPFFVPRETIKISFGNKYKYNKRNPLSRSATFYPHKNQTGTKRNN